MSDFDERPRGPEGVVVPKRVSPIAPKPASPAGKAKMAARGATRKKGSSKKNVKAPAAPPKEESAMSLLDALKEKYNLGDGPLGSVELPKSPQFKKDLLALQAKLLPSKATPVKPDVLPVLFEIESALMTLP
jgi:hypothetical protein